jgi:hypothetical protein
MARDYSRRWFVSRLGLIGCALPLRTFAQRAHARHLRRIGLLLYVGAPPTLVKAFEEEM